MKNKFFSVFLLILTLVSVAEAQRAEVTVSLNEQFFDALLDAIFKNLNSPEFPIAKVGSEFKVQSSKLPILSFQEGKKSPVNPKSKSENCNEVIRLLRESGGVRTAVRFREGRILAPVAFSGSYNPPLIGCIEFQGWAETAIELGFDKEKQALTGRIKVLNVQLGSAGNLTAGILTRIVQNSIDERLNPIEILPADKLSFVVPIQNSGGSLRMKAVNLQHRIDNGVLYVHITYDFFKAN